MPPLSETELTNAIKNQQPFGAQVLYDRYGITLFKLIHSKLHNRQAAEDVLLATFDAACRQIKTHRPDEQRLLVWMAGIARKLALQATTSALVPVS
jgi:DNA-directed RNA polymerase specialized sigma24 family protein